MRAEGGGGGSYSSWGRSGPRFGGKKFKIEIVSSIIWWEEPQDLKLTLKLKSEVSVRYVSEPKFKSEHEKMPLLSS